MRFRSASVFPFLSLAVGSQVCLGYIGVPCFSVVAETLNLTSHICVTGTFPHEPFPEHFFFFNPFLVETQRFEGHS